jgi:hypothetical protein
VATGVPYDRGVSKLRVQPPPGGRVRPGLLAPIVVGIVLGILAMHGIGAHGANLHGSLTPAVAATPASAAVGHAPVAVDGTHPHSVGDPEHTGLTGATGATSGVGGVVVMCVAMLAGAAAALLTLLVRRGRLPGVWAVLGPAGRHRAPVPPVLRVGTGPPVAWRFSVIRC